jgi:glutathionyl-hydroquinone reductase
VNPSGGFTRDQRYITTRITAGGRGGFPAEPGRYRLVVSRACPRASRAVIVRRRPGAPGLYPERRRSEIDEVARLVFQDVSDGACRRGFTGTQGACEKACRRLSGRLGWLSARLQGQRYLAGDTITEAGIRLFTTLARLDAVYHGHFKCNRHKLTEMPVLRACARGLFQTPGSGDAIDFGHIKRHYYLVHRDINPAGVVPAGPGLSGWPGPHGRDALGGRPFGDGTPPGPPPPGETVPPAHTPLAA